MHKTKLKTNTNGIQNQKSKLWDSVLVTSEIGIKGTRRTLKYILGNPTRTVTPQALAAHVLTRESV